jgi:hypothetical protein
VAVHASHRAGATAARSKRTGASPIAGESSINVPVAVDVAAIFEVLVDRQRRGWAHATDVQVEAGGRPA